MRVVEDVPVETEYQNRLHHERNRESNAYYQPFHDVFVPFIIVQFAKLALSKLESYEEEQACEHDTGNVDDKENAKNLRNLEVNRTCLLLSMSVTQD